MWHTQLIKFIVLAKMAKPMITFLSFCSLVCLERSYSFEYISSKNGVHRHPEYFPEHLRPFLNANATGVGLGAKGHHTLAIRYATPQGMHKSLEVMGSVLLSEKSKYCVDTRTPPAGVSEVGAEVGDCSSNVLIVFDLPVGVFVDPYELKSRYEYGWDNVVVHTSSSSLAHLSAEVFTRGAEPFILAVELLGIPLEMDDGADNVRGGFHFTLPLHMRYSSDFVPRVDGIENSEKKQGNSLPLTHDTPNHHSQCGPHRHVANALVSVIKSPLVFVGRSNFWSSGVAFAASSSPAPTVVNSEKVKDGDNVEDGGGEKMEMEGSFIRSDCDYYVRGEGDSPEQKLAMHASHRHAQYTVSAPVGVQEEGQEVSATTSSSSHAMEYELLFATEVMDHHRARRMISDDNIDKILYFEDKSHTSCVFATNSGGDMEVYLHMPVPSREHVYFVFSVTFLTILLTTACMSYSLLIPPATGEK